MATKIFCDGCGIDITEKGRTAVPFKKHLIRRHDVRMGYEDRECNPVSDASETRDLCNKCYNIVMGTAWQAFVDIPKATTKTKDSKGE